MPGCDDGLERERSDGPSKRSSFRRSSAPILSSSCSQERDAARHVFLCTRTVRFLRIIQWFVEEHRLRERANGATSGATGPMRASGATARTNGACGTTVGWREWSVSPRRSDTFCQTRAAAERRRRDDVESLSPTNAPRSDQQCFHFLSYFRF